MVTHNEKIFWGRAKSGGGWTKVFVLSPLPTKKSDFKKNNTTNQKYKFPNQLVKPLHHQTSVIPIPDQNNTKLTPLQKRIQNISLSKRQKSGGF